MNRIRTALVTFCSLLLIAGCSTPQVHPEIEQQQNEEGIDDGGKKIPLSLRVIDEVNDGKNIHVQAGVTAAVRWNTQDVVAVLTSLRDGVRVGQNHSQLSEMLGGKAMDSVFMSSSQPIIKANKELVFTLKIPAEGVTDYQLELLWGKDADLHLKRDMKSKMAPSLQLRGVQIVSHSVQCDAPPCGSKHSVTGVLVNSGSSVAKKAVLGVGYLWIPSGVQLKSQVPKSEEKMELAIALQPGRTRKFTFHLDQVVPAVDGGEFRPAVRLLPDAARE